ncbi:N-acetylglucosamine repressor [Hartmannibacter diazotrophicus]|uniref:N-acetylglucosamine repressor n=1 Tax=Hartmannibacter diazotrophicus TaxID=1482074 RepID=A0A2C9D245_9HYPH|nr:ROK family protein [Hartmannibacter diazotrophicus]SON54447.1 N-acetylglucosamine repressor [Hartmannibacter diazotrophicus]
MTHRRPWRGQKELRADTDQVRRHNRSLVLAALRRHAPIARVDLGAATQLSPATITAITADLIQENIVETVTLDTDAAQTSATEAPRKPTAARGRPRVMLQLNRRTAFVLAVKITMNKVVLVLADYLGAIVAQRTLTPETLKETRTSFPRFVVGAIHDFLGEEKIRLKDLAEIGIGAQGVVDTNKGSIAWSPAFSDRDIELVRPVARAFGIPCFISNDGNMIAQALNWSDPERYGGTFAVIFAEYGVGMGLFVGGRLHAGANGSAAELGHVNHVPGGPLCSCGRRGCLEAFTADYAIVREARQLPPDSDPLEIRPTPEELVVIENAARDGDERLAGIYRNVGVALGYGLARLMAIINPDRIIITGASARAYELIEGGLMSGIEEAVVEDLRCNTRIETLPYDQDLIIAGLIADALARLDHDVFALPLAARLAALEPQGAR